MHTPKIDPYPSSARMVKPTFCEQIHKAYELSHLTKNLESGISNMTLMQRLGPVLAHLMELSSQTGRKSLASEELLLSIKIPGYSYTIKTDLKSL